ncbi:MAG: DUF3570 domain-containing protein [Myxococcales bacterium]|nr:DUF3570 domain-containing protein [Myxococcales bacterium]
MRRGERQLTRALAWLGCALLLGLWAVKAAADEVTGTWTGAVEAHGNYFLERSTRVIMPEFKLELESPAGVDVDVEYLVDVISSASIAQTGSDEDDVFTEYRHQAGAHLGYELDIGEPLELTAGFIFSSEDDYTSRIYLVNAALALWDRNTTISAGGSFTDDTVLSNADPLFEDGRRVVTLNGSIEQVMGPTFLLTLGYSVSVLEGFLANPYRRALKGPLPFPEDHPRERTRHAAYGKLAWFIPPSNTAVHLTHRVYVDTWKIGALNPELRVVQELHENFLLGAHYRFYIQNSAFFYQEAYPAGFDGYVTNDPKMAEHETHLFGPRIDWRLAFFEDAGMPWLARGWAVLTFDRYLSSNVFGDGYVATVGGRLPF